MGRSFTRRLEIMYPTPKTMQNTAALPSKARPCYRKLERQGDYGKP